MPDIASSSRPDITQPVPDEQTSAQFQFPSMPAPSFTSQSEPAAKTGGVDGDVAWVEQQVLSLKAKHEQAQTHVDTGDYWPFDDSVMGDETQHKKRAWSGGDLFGSLNVFSGSDLFGNSKASYSGDEVSRASFDFSAMFSDNEKLD